MLLITLCFFSVILCLYYGDKYLEVASSNEISLADCNSRQKAIKKYIWTFIWILTLFSAVRHGFIDTYAYKIMYRRSRFNWDYVWTGAGWQIEYGWLITCYLLNYICSSPNFILFIAALLINWAFTHTIHKYSEDIIFSLWMYFCMNWLDTNNGIRQFVASALSMLALPLLLNQEKNIKKRIIIYLEYIIIIICGMQWHNSLKICIPIMFSVLGKAMNWKTLISTFLCIAFTMGMGFANDAIMLGAGDTKYVEHYLIIIAGGMGIPRAIITGFLPLFFIILYFLKYKKKMGKISYVDGILINMLIMHSAFTILGLRVQIFARLCFYTFIAYYIMMPKLMKLIFENKYQSIRKIAFIFLTFYYWYNIYVNYLYGTTRAFYFDVEF